MGSGRGTDVGRWLASVEAVVEARRCHDAAWQALVRSLVQAHEQGATWDEISYAAGLSRSTVRRWVLLAPARANVLDRVRLVVVPAQASGPPCGDGVGAAASA